MLDFNLIFQFAHAHYLKKCEQSVQFVTTTGNEQTIITTLYWCSRSLFVSEYFQVGRKKNAKKEKITSKNNFYSRIRRFVRSYERRPRLFWLGLGQPKAFATNKFFKLLEKETINENRTDALQKDVELRGKQRKVRFRQLTFGHSFIYTVTNSTTDFLPTVSIWFVSVCTKQNAFHVKEKDCRGYALLFRHKLQS